VQREQPLDTTSVIVSQAHVSIKKNYDAARGRFRSRVLSATFVSSIAETLGRPHDHA
jgi:hypothetical protein